jgi:phosphopantothenoylcysteine decarboxylase/phosphopantothenate--cysteine ligase
LATIHTGKMGIAIAECFANAGNEVTLILGATHLLPYLKTVKVVKVNTATEMLEAATQYFDNSDVIVFAAAVADYTPANPSNTKIKKNDDTFTLELKKTKDIAMELGKQKRQGQTIVGFALETDNEQQNALEKLKKKNFDFVVLNSMKDEGAGFKHDTNKITILDKSGNETKFELKAKQDVAKDIYDYTLKIRALTP